MAEVHMDFPSNSLKGRLPQSDFPPPNAPERPKLEKIIDGNVTQRKKPWAKRTIGMLIVQDIRTTGVNLFNDVLIPSLRDLAFDMVQGAASSTFGVDIRRASTTSLTRFVQGQQRSVQTASPQTNYNAISRPASTRPPMGLTAAQLVPETITIDDLVFDDRGQAERVLEGLDNLIEEYGQASVWDLYEMVGISTDFVQQKWGWRNMQGASVTRTRDQRYALTLPKIQSIA